MTNQKNRSVSSRLRNLDEGVTWLIAGLAICALCFWLSYLMGGLSHPVGASMLAFPVIAFCLVLVPTAWEQFRVDHPRLFIAAKVLHLRLQCHTQARANRRAIAGVRSLRKEILLGLVHSSSGSQTVVNI